MINPITYLKRLREKEKEKEKGKEIINMTERILTKEERKAIITMIKLSDDAIKELRKKVIENDEDKKKIIKCIEGYNNMMDIEKEDGKPYTKEDYKEMSSAELTQLLWDAQQYAAKNLLTKEETEKIFGKEED